MRHYGTMNHEWDLWDNYFFFLNKKLFIFQEKEQQLTLKSHSCKQIPKFLLVNCFCCLGYLGMVNSWSTSINSQSVGREIGQREINYYWKNFLWCDFYF
jgi:hypothetical protein